MQNETTWSDTESLNYHNAQLGRPKFSTIDFGSYFEENLSKSKNVLDMACGAGGPTIYLADLFPRVNFSGLDRDPELLQVARSHTDSSKSNNPSFIEGDWLNLEENLLGKFDGVISLQTLSWMETLEAPLKQIFTKIRPEWLGISSLFYEGDISCQTKVLEHSRRRETYYNTYSLPELDRISRKFGYELSGFRKFEIPVDLPKQNEYDRMGTFTLQVEEDKERKRLQFSGPLLMNWYNVLIKKSASAAQPLF
jgi:SAM-dependent methyltransferase